MKMKYSRCANEDRCRAGLDRSCRSASTAACRMGESTNVKTSCLAIASLGLGILSVFTFAVTAIPALVLGLISCLRIERSGGKLSGEGFAVVGIAVSAVVFFTAGIAMPALGRARQLSFRAICANNLSHMNKAMRIYANDYDDELPRAGGKNSTWGPTIADYKATTRRTAFGLARDGGGGRANISSSFYLLVKYAEVTPRLFVCPGDPGVTDFRLSDYDVRDKEYFEVWDFGPYPAGHCIYSYHMPYGPHALKTASDPGMAIVADRNPWIDAPAAKAKDFSLFKWDGDDHRQRAGNAIAHLEDGQNVVFNDGHVAFEKRAFCGVDKDNIYTFSAGPPKQQGNPPVLGESQPQNRIDSLLVQDGDRIQTPPKK